jgi:hypothetical protein
MKNGINGNLVPSGGNFATSKREFPVTLLWRMQLGLEYSVNDTCI